MTTPWAGGCRGARTLKFVSTPLNDGRPARGWVGGPDWEASVDARRLDELRWRIEQEISTLRGFRRRLKTEAEYSLLGLVLGIPFLIPQVLGLIEAFTSAPEPGIGVLVEWLSRPAVTGWVTAGVLLIGISVVSIQVRLRREFGFFRSGGWVALQASTGLAEWGGEGETLVAYDHRLVGGNRDVLPRHLQRPYMLVSGPRMPVSVFAHAVRGVRASTVARVFDGGRLKMLKRQVGTLRAIPATAVFAHADGCLIGAQDDGWLTVALPRAVKDGQRIRLARVKLTRSERDSVATGRPS